MQYKAIASLFYILKYFLLPMNPLTPKTLKMLSRSGLILIFLSMIGSFAMAAMSINKSIAENTWNEFFGVLMLAVSGIAVYYLSLAIFGWVLMKAKKASPA